MSNSLKQTIVSGAALLGVLAFASSASALSLNLEFSGGETSLNLTPADVSSTHTVSLFADLAGGGGGGVFFLAGSIQFSSSLTPLRCKEQGGTFNNGVGGVPTWGPLTPDCGSTNQIPGGTAQSLEQGVTSGTAGGTFGKLKIGTVTFHVSGTGNETITPFYVLAADGFIQNDGTTFTSTTPVFGAVVNIIPEPATAVLLGLGIVGIGISGRRRRG
jgi:hypothetical protein